MTVILFFLLAMVTLTGIFAYQRFSSIITQFNYEARPDLTLVTAKNLENKLGEAENCVISYSLTNDTTHLLNYYESVEKSHEILSELQRLNFYKSENLLIVDSLNQLAEIKFSILNDLLTLRDKYRVQEALDKVEKKIEQTVVAGQVQNEQKENERKEKNNILKKIFRKKEKDRQKEAIANREILIKDVTRELNKIRAEEQDIESILKTLELSLANENRIISEKIKGRIGKLEKSEHQSIVAQAIMAQEEMQFTNSLIAVFFVLIAGLIIFMAFLVTNFIKNNNRFKKAMRNAKNEAEELVKTKERFFANISHEIRTPMNAIAGFSEQLADSELNHYQKQQLHIVRKSVEHLLNIINDVLDYSKLKAGKLMLAENGFKLKETIEETMLFSEPIAKNKKIELKVKVNNDVPEIVIGDQLRLRQILLNLISNAVKFTSKGYVHINAEVETRIEKKIKLKIEVADTGIGMNEAELKKIFNEFEQAERSSTRNYGGTGLGLSITKKLVELHHGEIKITSRPGEGAIVTVFLPYIAGDITDLKQTLIKKKNGVVLNDIKVLVVDDEQYNRKLLTSILKKYDAEFSEAENGFKALSELDKNEFDLVLMDVRMPEMNGIDAVKKIRAMQNKRKSEIPVIALTAAISPADQIVYEDAGMNGFLPKPFTENEFINAVSDALNTQLIMPENDEERINENNLKKIKSSRSAFSLHLLEEVSDGDNEFLKEMLVTLLETTNDGMSAINAAIKIKDLKTVGDFAHKIRSPCLHVGATELYNLLEEIEYSCRKIEKTEKIPELVTKAEAEVNSLLKWVENELKKLETKKITEKI